jgi:hypothetical protein
MHLIDRGDNNRGDYLLSPLDNNNVISQSETVLVQWVRTGIPIYSYGHRFSVEYVTGIRQYTSDGRVPGTRRLLTLWRIGTAPTFLKRYFSVCILYFERLKCNEKKTNQSAQ